MIKNFVLDENEEENQNGLAEIKEESETHEIKETNSNADTDSEPDADNFPDTQIKIQHTEGTQ